MKPALVLIGFSLFRIRMRHAAIEATLRLATQLALREDRRHARLMDHCVPFPALDYCASAERRKFTANYTQLTSWVALVDSVPPPPNKLEV